MSKRAGDVPSAIISDGGNPGAKPGDIAGDTIIVDPATITADATGSDGDGDGGNDRPAGGKPRRKYTKRAGSVPAAKEKKLDINGVEKLLLTIHAGVAALTQIPECQMAQDEANALATGMAGVARHYEMRGVPEKVVDWTNLFIVIGTVYGTRVMAYNMRMSAEHAKRGPQANIPQNMGVQGYGGL